MCVAVDVLFKSNGLVGGSASYGFFEDSIALAACAAWISFAWPESRFIACIYG